MKRTIVSKIEIKLQFPYVAQAQHFLQFTIPVSIRTKSDVALNVALLLLKVKINRQLSRGKTEKVSIYFKDQ